MVMSTYNDWLHELSQGKTIDFVYFIEIRKKLNKFFFLTLNENNTHLQIVWTPSLGRAHIFMTEEIVEEFKADYINPRRASIVRMKPLEALLIQ